MEDDHKQRQDEWLISISLNRNVTGFKRAQLLAVPQRQRESVMRRRRAKKKKNIPKWRQGYFLQYANEGQTFFSGKNWNELEVADWNVIDHRYLSRSVGSYIIRQPAAFSFRFRVTKEREFLCRGSCRGSNSRGILVHFLLAELAARGLFPRGENGETRIEKNWPVKIPKGVAMNPSHALQHARSRAAATR